MNVRDGKAYRDRTNAVIARDYRTAHSKRRADPKPIRPLGPLDSYAGTTHTPVRAIINTSPFLERELRKQSHLVVPAAGFLEGRTERQ